MTKQTYHELQKGQMVITFSDLEGDLPFLQRSLALYRTRYEEAYPENKLSEHDFTIAKNAKGKEIIQLPTNVICVNIGDLTDKSKSNTGRTESYNCRLVDIVNNTHEEYGSRMISILGNRETTKFRIKSELNVPFINHVFEKELSISPDKRADTAMSRDPSLVWVDGPAKSFLLYLVQELKIDPQANNERLNLAFNELSDEQKTIYYAKWMFANSTGAGPLWNELAEENKTLNDSETLQFIQNYFTNPDSPYVKFLGHCQIGVQIGNTLFTHGGIEDNSFNLPASLNGHDTPQNARELLDTLNAWYASIHSAHYTEANTSSESPALKDLINMGLPAGRNQGASLINMKFTDSNGAYGNPISNETRMKLSKVGIHNIYHGHMPAQRPRVGTTINEIDDKGLVLHRIGADTCNYRKEQAAIAVTFVMNESKGVDIQLNQIDEQGSINMTRVPRKNEDGTLSQTDFYSLLGRPVVLDASGTPASKGWNILGLEINNNQPEFTLFKQNGFPKFNPETISISGANLSKYNPELGIDQMIINELSRTSQKLEQKEKELEQVKQELMKLKESIHFIGLIEKNEQLQKDKAELIEQKIALQEENKALQEERNKLSAEVTGLKQSLEQQKKHEASLSELQMKLINTVNDPKEAKYRALINKKLLPMTNDYLAHLKSLKIDAAVSKKSSAIAELHGILQDHTKYPLPSQKVEQFFKTLNDSARTLGQHRDATWVRYIKNALIAGGILLSGIIPGLVFLALYTKVGNTAGKHMTFWQSRGSSFCEDLQEIENQEVKFSPQSRS